MKERKLKLLVVCIVVGCFVTAGPAFADKTFLFDTLEDWNDVLTDINGMSESGWTEYMLQWKTFTEEGNSYPNDVFLPPSGLYVYGGGGSWIDPCTAEEYNYPEDAGLVMSWGDACSMPDGNFSSAWVYDFNQDPDLRNCTITVTVTAPQFGLVPPHTQINQVSLGLQNLPLVGGPIRAWYWNCGPGQPIPWNTPTTITIDTSKTGRAAATPTASSFMSNPGFSLQFVQYIVVDEGGKWVGGPQNAPPPGGGIGGMWNYWHNLAVAANPPTGAVPGKWYVKWSQPPVKWVSDPNFIWGWDELSDHNGPQIVADDWRCKDNRPVTDIHWWGSFIGWNLPVPPAVRPQKFHIGIWNDIPDPNPGDPSVFSHPNELLWENYCDNWVWNFEGHDKDPCDRPERDMETCFQFTQLLSQDEWFYQDPNDPCEPAGRVYWLSIAAIYNPADYPIQYPWGWKTREHFFNDDAVRITDANHPVNGTTWPPTPPTVGSKWVLGNPIYFPDPNYSWDVAFELTTNEPNYADDPIPGDWNADKIVNLVDLDIMATNWLTTAP